MSKEEKTIDQSVAASAGPKDQGARLLETYGAHLADSGLGARQQEELLLTLWQIMQAFVDIGFSVKPGDNFTPDSDLGMQDVLDWLGLEETAPETVAPEPDNKTEEPCR